MNFTMEQYQESARALRERLGEFTPKVAMVLGSGLGGFADNVKIGGVYDSRSAALEAAALAASYTVSDGGAVQIIVPGAAEEKPRWGVAFDVATAVAPLKSVR